jgi:hypothetical protein
MTISANPDLIELGERATPAASVYRFKIQGGLLLLERSSNSLFAFNETARHVWDLIEAGKSHANLVSEFAETWGISRSLAQQDIQSIVAHWRAHGLLSGGDSGPVQTACVNDAAVDFNPAAPPLQAAEWVCTIRGIAIAISIDTKPIALIRELFRHLETPTAPPRSQIKISFAGENTMVFTQDGRERLRTADPAEAAGELYIAILERIHPNVLWFALVHGAALARNGHGLALVGSSGSGKSTLTAGLMAAGFDYLSDDLVALSEPAKAIMPWPLPLSIKPGSFDVVSRLWPELTQVPSYRTWKGLDARLLVPPAAAWDAQPAALRRVVFPYYAAGVRPELTRLSLFQTIERLLSDRIWLGGPITEERVTAFLAWLEDIPAYALTYADLDDAVRLIEDVVA